MFGVTNVKCVYANVCRNYCEQLFDIAHVQRVKFSTTTPSKPSTLVFFVNGKKVVDKNVDPEWTLLYYLRNKLKLCGTKYGCGAGSCGVCTVTVSNYDAQKHTVVYSAISSCLRPVCSMHGHAVTTVEGIGSVKKRLHPIQERIVKVHGSRCGFCTPGIIMSMYSLIRNKQHPTKRDIDEAFQGNLCRCTGYRPVLESIKTFTREFEEMCASGETAQAADKASDLADLRSSKCIFTPYDPSNDPPFPTELTKVPQRQSMFFKGKKSLWYKPLDLNEMLELKARHPNGMVVRGNTDIGIEFKFRDKILIEPAPELTTIEDVQNGIRIGAAVTLEEVRRALRERITTMHVNKTKIFKSIVDMLYCFSNEQVRNVACIGGNIMNTSAVADLVPILMASNSVLEIQSKKEGLKKLKFDNSFFTGYRKNVVRGDEVLLAINIPLSKENQYFYTFKQSRRKEDDIAIVNCAFHVTFKKNTNIIQDINIVYGCMAPTTIMALGTMKKLIGLPWDKATLNKAYNYLAEDMVLTPDAPPGMVNYRRTVSLSLFLRMFLSVSQYLEITLPKVKLDSFDLTGLQVFKPLLAQSPNYSQLASDSYNKSELTVPPVAKLTYSQATGETVYTNDLPQMENEVHIAFVYSTKANALIKSIDESEALKMEGVHGFFSAKDLMKYQNVIGHALDEEIFASSAVTSCGQIIAAVVADDKVIAKTAALSVKVIYEDRGPVIVSMEDAIKNKSFHFDEPRCIESGDVEKAFKAGPNVIEGDCRTGGQEHFYMEPHIALAVPNKDNLDMVIYCTTQNPNEVTAAVARALGLPLNKIVTTAHKLGGAFGGKQTKPALIAVPAAFVAKRMNRPVRAVLERNEDAVLTGGRHPFYIKYKAAFDADGKVSAYEAHLYCNAGYSVDLSLIVLERALLHAANAYSIPNVRLFGYVCKTNIHSNTMFRQCGAPQPMFAAENMIRDVAEHLKMDVNIIVQNNLYRPGDLTFYKKKLDYCTIRKCWSECLQSASYDERSNEIATFNSENRWKKRGISAVPTKFGIGFHSKLLQNHQGPLIHVTTDGSVSLSCGGAPMDKDMKAKATELMTKALEVPADKIQFSDGPAPGEKAPRSLFTEPELTNACNAIKARVEPYRSKKPNGKWEEWVADAHKDNVCLTATGFSLVKVLDRKTNLENSFDFFMYGAACTEVIVDCITGNHKVLRADIIMDIGESITPQIDVSKTEGGFLKGYGLFMMEEMVYCADGTLFSDGPTRYKCPGFTDIPAEFNVCLLQGAPKVKESTKDVGEPVIFLASSVLFAAREAIKAARKDAGVKEKFRINAPATCVALRMACKDNITAKFQEPKPGTFKPWSVVP